ncbi:unnamed protein product [Dicrocoelium dendriticum]|nr:unnamed protein product [Dicrocoelium dendriticum]
MSIKKEESMLEFDRKVPSVMKMEPTGMDLITVAGPCKSPTSVLSGSNFPSSAPWYQMPGNKVTPIDPSHNTNATYPYFAAHCLASNAFDPGEESNKTMEPTGTPTFHIVDTALDLRMHQNTYAGLCVPQEQAAAFDAQNPVTYWNDCNEECETTAKLMCSFAFPDSVQLEPLAALQSQFAPKVEPQESLNSRVPELINALRSVLFTQYFRAWYNYTLMDQPSLIPISSSRWSVMQPEYHMQNNYQVPSLCSSDSASNVLGRLLDTTNSLTSSLWNSALSHVNDQGEVFATAEAFCNRYSPPLNFSAFAMDQNMLCPICRKCFRFEKNLLRHLQKAHATGTGESVLKCKLCNYTTRHYSNMYVHIRTHTGESVLCYALICYIFSP